MTARKSSDSKLPWRKTASGIGLSVRLTPRASRDAVDGAQVLADDRVVLAARVRAIPDKNKANMALVKLLTNWLGVISSDVSISSGHTSRLKSVSIDGDPIQLASIAQSRMDDLKSTLVTAKGA